MRVLMFYLSLGAALCWFMWPSVMGWWSRATAPSPTQYLGTLQQVHYLSDWGAMTQIDLEQSSVLVLGVVSLPRGSSLVRELRSWNSNRICAVHSEASSQAQPRCWNELVGQ